MCPTRQPIAQQGFDEVRGDFGDDGGQPLGLRARVQAVVQGLEGDATLAKLAL